MRIRRVPEHLKIKVIKWFDYLWMTQKSSDEEKSVGFLPGIVFQVHCPNHRPVFSPLCGDTSKAAQTVISFGAVSPTCEPPEDDAIVCCALLHHCSAISSRFDKELVRGRGQNMREAARDVVRANAGPISAAHADHQQFIPM